MTSKRDPRPDDLMTTGEAARLLGLSADMVRWLEREDRLPAERTTNGVRLFRRRDVERLAAERARVRGDAEARLTSPNGRKRASRGATGGGT